MYINECDFTASNVSDYNYDTMLMLMLSGRLKTCIDFSALSSVILFQKVAKVYISYIGLFSYRIICSGQQNITLIDPALT